MTVTPFLRLAHTGAGIRCRSAVHPCALGKSGVQLCRTEIFRVGESHIPELLLNPAGWNEGFHGSPIAANMLAMYSSIIRSFGFNMDADTL
jgi:hypothetical protein